MNKWWFIGILLLSGCVSRGTVRLREEAAFTKGALSMQDRFYECMKEGLILETKYENLLVQMEIKGFMPKIKDVKVPEEKPKAK